MEIQIKIFATLRELLPVGTVSSTFTKVLRDANTLNDLRKELGIPSDVEMIMVVNGRYMDGDYRLQNGDRVSILQPIYGG